MDNSKHENVPDPSHIDNAGTGRSYECNFCKRGFTNAQALGGHMNIHRKEKAKAGKESINIFHKTSFSNPFFSDQDSNIESSKCSEAKVNHQFYFPLPNPSHSPYACYRSDPSTVVASSNNYDSNLSLDMGSWRGTKDDELKKDINARDEKMEHEVDLELRLGHYRKN